MVGRWVNRRASAARGAGFGSGFFAASLLWACSCSPVNICDLAERAPVLFIGQVVDGGLTGKDDPWNSDVGFARFRVIAAFRGVTPEAREVTVKFMNPVGMCSPIPFHRGGTYLVAPSKTESGLFEGSCGSSRDVTRNQEDVEYVTKFFAGKARTAVSGVVAAMDRADLAGNPFAYRKPLAEAGVVASRGGRSFEARTDAKGAYKVYVNTPGVYDVTIRPKGYDPITQKVTAAMEGCRISYAVAHSRASIIGTATMANGLPLSRASVYLIDADEWETLDPESADTKPDGSFAFSNVPLGRWLISLRPGRLGGYQHEITYAPGASNRESAQIIDIKVPGQQARADVRQGPEYPLRRMEIRVTSAGPSVKSAGFQVELPEGHWDWVPLLSAPSAAFDAPANRRVKLVFVDLSGRTPDGTYTLEIPPGTGPIARTLTIP